MDSFGKLFISTDLDDFFESHYLEVAKMNEEKERQNRERIISALEPIGWTLKHFGCDHYRFVDHNQKVQPVEFFSDRIELKDENYKFQFVFYLDETGIKEIENSPS